MILNSKGKFFNKINIIDVLIIILVIVALIGAYFRFNGDNIVAENKPCTFKYTITIRDIREQNKDLLEESKKTKTPFVLDGKINSTMGKLIDVHVSEAVKEVEKNRWYYCKCNCSG